MDLLQKFTRYIAAENLFTKKDRLLLAVSGGVDSVVLCELCKQAGFDFVVAHCNFQLRGEESDGDETFVEALAKKYEVPYFVKRFDTETYSRENHLSIQVAARQLRYDWFRQLIIQLNDRHTMLLTAHHADDNMETILMNFFKGSGINGLKGMLPKQNDVVRPLLFAGKEDILSFAHDNKLTYREDSSNSSDKYTRNYFRNQLIPGLEKIFPQVKQNLLSNATRFREINELYQDSINRIRQELITKKGDELHIPVLKLLKASPLATILYEITREFGFSASQGGEVEKLLHAESGKYIESETHRILHNRNWLIIAPLKSTEATQYLVKETDAQVNFPLGTLQLLRNNTAVKVQSDPFIAQVDARNLTFPLLVRKWKKGDYFYPLGMPHKKKLSRFFNDIKSSVIDRENTWVVESNKKIIWVIGKRIDDRFKISPSSTSTIQFTLRPA